MSNLSWNRLGFWAVLASCGWLTLGCDATPDGTVEDPQIIEGEAYPTDDTMPEATWEDGDLDASDRDADPAATDPEDAAPPLPALDDIPDVSPEVPEPQDPELTPETPEFDSPELPDLNDLPELPESEETLPDSGLDIEQELDNIESGENQLP